MSELIVVRNRPPDYRCEMCGSSLYRDEYRRHMRLCLARNYERVVGETATHRLSGIFGPEAGDVELVRWVRRHRRPLAEGRLRL